jgi:alpha-glucuronidase
MYYGAVGLASFGSLVVIVSFVYFCRTRLTRSLEEYAHRAYNALKSGGSNCLLE